MSFMRPASLNPFLTTLLSCVAALTAFSCADTECTPGQTKCEDNVFHACRNYEWKTVVCENNAPICDDKRGCLQRSDSTDPPPSTTKCDNGQQMCVANTFYKCSANQVWNIIPCPQSLPICDDNLGCIASTNDD